MKLRTAIIHAAKQQGIGPRRLAKRVRCSESSMSRLLAKKSWIKGDRLERLLVVLGLDVKPKK